jgi:hypothetical protein
MLRDFKFLCWTLMVGVIWIFILPKYIPFPEINFKLSEAYPWSLMGYNTLGQSMDMLFFLNILYWLPLFGLILYVAFQFSSWALGLDCFYVKAHSILSAILPTIFLCSFFYLFRQISIFSLSFFLFALVSVRFFEMRKNFLLEDFSLEITNPYISFGGHFNSWVFSEGYKRKWRNMLVKEALFSYKLMMVCLCFLGYLNVEITGFYNHFGELFKEIYAKASLNPGRQEIVFILCFLTVLNIGDLGFKLIRQSKIWQ